MLRFANSVSTKHIGENKQTKCENGNVIEMLKHKVWNNDHTTFWSPKTWALIQYEDIVLLA